MNDDQHYHYDLSSANDNINKIIEILDSKENNPTLYESLIKKSWKYNEKTYNIIKYNKSLLTMDSIESNGLFRSVICSNNLENMCINVFSPPKAYPYGVFKEINKESDCYAEELVEGTMINLFYDEEINRWEIATKTSVGGNIKYFEGTSTFGDMFREICDEIGINVNDFTPGYMYSFVIQHPQNRFVNNILQKRLYLISIYKIEGLKISIIGRDQYSNFGEILNKIWHPYQFGFNSYEDLEKIYGSENTVIDYMGVIIKKSTGQRTKIRNPNYEYLRYLRGNNRKLQYHYICLRQQNRVKEYLHYYPEETETFTGYRKLIHEFTKDLYSNYINCYIKKQKPILEFPKQFRVHMFNLHQEYLTIRENNGYINKEKVILYINNLEPAKLMYSINYKFRVNKEEENKEDYEM